MSPRKSSPKIFSVDSTKWSDIRPEWPAEDILRYSPGTDSGTFDYFVEAVMNPVYVKDATADAGKGEEAILKAGNLTQSEDDNVLVQGVEGSPLCHRLFRLCLLRCRSRQSQGYLHRRHRP